MYLALSNSCIGINENIYLILLTSVRHTSKINKLLKQFIFLTNVKQHQFPKCYFNVPKNLFSQATCVVCRSIQPSRVLIISISALMSSLTFSKTIAHFYFAYSLPTDNLLQVRLKKNENYSVQKKRRNKMYQKVNLQRL